ncbi:hypothetical protein HMPREF0492_1100 [Lactobacillus acidophilus ATCC 4796]|uniref:hypothetical protein n=1 Tax=Lactobacillus acidophilus TaxID=1579 RepID=UPI00019F5E80|nr:hypothetical protein [Lactobacillus acidophilus]EEJ75944.1 hypothetical protein HMPREF0492_1100 [Lactobacillus acidophilus ATCC 4796]
MIKYNKGVRHFFKEDYPRLYLLSGSQITTKINLKDKSRVGYYWNIFAVTWLTINRLEDTPQHPYKTIIVERFVKRTSMIKVRELISYSQGKSNDLANQALKNLLKYLNRNRLRTRFIHC